jgi:hypothetical protein
MRYNSLFFIVRRTTTIDSASEKGLPHLRALMKSPMSYQARRELAIEQGGIAHAGLRPHTR